MLDLMTDAAFIPIGALISIGARGAVVCTVPRMGTTASVTLALDMGSGGGSRDRDRQRLAKRLGHRARSRLHRRAARRGVDDEVRCDASSARR